MNTNVKSIREKTLRTVSLLLASLLMINCTTNLKADNPVVIPDPEGKTDTKKIKIALLLDTSNSMDGLIEQAKSQLWTIVNELSKASCPDDSKPALEIALYEYGNDWLTPAEGYIRMVTPLTNDLDKISEDLFKLTTYGGSEFCGHVIQTSLNQLAWGTSNEDLQVIFIAGNEPFTQGTIDYRKACANAKNKNVVVNTIYCGNFDAGISELWKNGADLTGGAYMSIDQNRKTVYLESPYDDQISNLNIHLNNTYIYYGQKGIEQKEKQRAQDLNSEKYGKQNSVNRTISKSSHMYENSGWDLVDAKKQNKDISKVEKEYLPKELQGMTTDELNSYIARKEKERSEITRQINDLKVKRESYLKEKSKEQAGDLQTLDNAMLKAVRDQAKSKKMVFEK